MSIQSIGVIGAGTMGNGIAQAFAVAGIPVVMVDIAQAALDRGMKTVDGSLTRIVSAPPRIEVITPAKVDVR